MNFVLQNSPLFILVGFVLAVWLVKRAVHNRAEKFRKDFSEPVAGAIEEVYDSHVAAYQRKYDKLDDLNKARADRTISARKAYGVLGLVVAVSGISFMVMGPAGIMSTAVMCAWARRTFGRLNKELEDADSREYEELRKAGSVD